MPPSQHYLLTHNPPTTYPKPHLHYITTHYLYKNKYHTSTSPIDYTLPYKKLVNQILAPLTHISPPRPLIIFHLTSHLSPPIPIPGQYYELLNPHTTPNIFDLYLFCCIYHTQIILLPNSFTPPSAPIAPAHPSSAHTSSAHPPLLTNPSPLYQPHHGPANSRAPLTNPQPLPVTLFIYQWLLFALRRSALNTYTMHISPISHIDLPKNPAATAKSKNPTFTIHSCSAT